MKKQAASLKKFSFYSLTLLLLACTGPGVDISLPANGSTVTSPVRVVANAVGQNNAAITNMTISVDGTAVGSPVAAGSVDTNVTIANGAHTITVNATDSNGVKYSAQAAVTVSGTTTPLPTGLVPSSKHVYVIVEENQEASVLSQMPYLNGLATTYAQATQFYAEAHPSIGNYFMMTAGQIFTTDDSYDSTITIDNIARQMIAQGISWKSYAESIPSVGYTGEDTGNYLKHHNPFSFFSDVVNSPTQLQNLVGWPQFQADFSAGTLPSYSFIVPNVNDDAHNGTPQEADTWLKTNIDPVIQSADFQNGNGLLVVTFDEGSELDSAHGGGHIPFILVSAKAKKGFQTQTLYQHENLLKLTCEAVGVKNCPGAASTANDMSEFFQ